MILATDVHYNDKGAVAAGVLFRNWQDARSEQVVIAEVAEVAEYVPGEFYQRELPCLLALLGKLKQEPICIVVDGFVFLDGHQAPGLGKHLYDALDGRVPVVGVAKSVFKDSPPETEVLRGESKHPLYVTSAGMPMEEAKALISGMHGKFRLPTLLKQADQACRKNRGTTQAQQKP